jgi:hypothetical protein
MPGWEETARIATGDLKKTICKLRAMLCIPDEYERVKPDENGRGSAFWWIRRADS